MSDRTRCRFADRLEAIFESYVQADAYVPAALDAYDETDEVCVSEYGFGHGTRSALTELARRRAARLVLLSMRPPVGDGLAAALFEVESSTSQLLRTFPSFVGLPVQPHTLGGGRWHR